MRLVSVISLEDPRVKNPSEQMPEDMLVFQMMKQFSFSQKVLLMESKTLSFLVGKSLVCWDVQSLVRDQNLLVKLFFLFVRIVGVSHIHVFSCQPHFYKVKLSMRRNNKLSLHLEYWPGTLPLPAVHFFMPISDGFARKKIFAFKIPTLESLPL